MYVEELHRSPRQKHMYTSLRLYFTYAHLSLPSLGPLCMQDLSVAMSKSSTAFLSSPSRIFIHQPEEQGISCMDAVCGGTGSPGVRGSGGTNGSLQSPLSPLDR